MDPKYDNNGENPIYGVSSVDGKTLVPIRVDSVTGALKMEIVATYPDTQTAPVVDLDEDNNGVPTIGGVNVDDFNIIPIRCDVNGFLKVEFI